MRYLLTLALLCASGSASLAAEDSSAAAGKVLFAENCSACHGPGGKGDGPAAAALPTPPADLTRIADRRDGVWPILEVMSIIDGYTQSVTPRPGMPVITALSEGPVVEFDTGNGLVIEVPERLIAVADYLESIQSPPPERYVP